MKSEAPFDRTLIIGNSGSGKTWLSLRLAETLGTEAVELDGIHWEPGGCNVARDKKLAIEAVRQAAAKPAWIIEGVYGWLAQEATSRATALIWLDIPVNECVNNLRQRGFQHGEDEAAFAELLKWTSDYQLRQTSSSFTGHERIFSTFTRCKCRLSAKSDLEQLIEKLRRG
jgi:adenylate kinase family enzyme